MLKFRLIKKKNIFDYIKLLSITFPQTKKFNYLYLEWLYFKNPTGTVVGFDAFDEDVLIGHYSLIPSEVLIKGVKTRSLLSLNTAVHPNFRNKGLFTKLANLSIKQAHKVGYEIIYGIANKNSLKGFKKIGFEFFGELDVIISLTGLRINCDYNDLEFIPVWDESFLEWRTSNPNRKIFTVYNQSEFFHYTKIFKYLLNLVTPKISGKKDFQLKHRNYEHNSMFKLHIGRVSKNIVSKNLFKFNLPLIFRKAPLNFIYLDLTGKNFINKNKIFFTFLDFDAY
ncbi:GNAT family N-acetyltransferase [Alphaproteobacteria bacterium]|nr:GNAT family N-acetyltransferase [Alphaproteobacteria bacterium]